MVTSPSQPGEFGFRVGTELSLALYGKFNRKHVRSRGSLPFTPALNIPEPIPEIVLPRRHSVSFQTYAGTISNEQDLLEDSELHRPHSPLRASDLVVPCSDAFEQVLKELETNHYQQ
ncbi:hypothetical protein PHET_09098 [Paragonimus heterotremus]|uniref:Uncharacterized protein n=1 Tax=Paragonimus heterotremus TaxID=100268 RepID=A0A8J4STZ1_9TREM|nr:hypothetical protein PHET_09098 [Paragonimus heterotremus]